MTDDIRDLVTRIRAKASNALHDEAADALERQAAEIDRLQGQVETLQRLERLQRETF